MCKRGLKAMQIKVMVLGEENRQCEFLSNGKQPEQIGEFKYLGNTLLPVLMNSSEIMVWNKYISNVQP